MVFTAALLLVVTVIVVIFRLMGGIKKENKGTGNRHGPPVMATHPRSSNGCGY